MVFPRNWPKGPKPTMPIFRILESDEADMVQGKRESQREREREREREEICAFILEIYDVWTGLVNG